MTASANPLGPSTESSGRSGRSLHPAQRILLFSSFPMIVGSFLTWVATGAGVDYGGFTGAGRFTFYAGVLALAGGLVPIQRLAGLQAAIAATACIGFPVWQIVHLIRLVGFGGWAPGVGLILVLVSGIVAAYAAVNLLLQPT